jgi:hypothetical protein
MAPKVIQFEVEPAETAQGIGVDVNVKEPEANPSGGTGFGLVVVALKVEVHCAVNCVTVKV